MSGQLVLPFVGVESVPHVLPLGGVVADELGPPLVDIELVVCDKVDDMPTYLMPWAII